MEIPEKYSRYTAADFIEEPGFIAYVRRPETVSESFWARVGQKYPSVAMDLEIARQLILFEAQPLTPSEETDVKEIEETIVSKIEKGVENKPVKVRELWHKAPIFRYGMAASVAAISLVSIWFFLVKQDMANSMVSVKTHQEMRTPVSLPDGSVVTLNRNSELRYSSDWSDGNAREVWLQGEGYFSVTKQQYDNELVKFVVHSRDLEAIVKGTRFNVRVKEGFSEVVLEEGKVDVALANDEKNAIVLLPGEMITVPKNTTNLEKHKVSSLIYTSWKDTMITLHETPMTDVAGMIEHNFDRKVVFVDEDLKNLRLGGTIPTNDLELVLTLIRKITPTKTEQKGNTIYLSRSK